MPKINQGVVINASLPIPPIDEQTAVVERIDKLMGIIDKLEKQVSERKDQAEMLTQSVLGEAFAGWRIILGACMMNEFEKIIHEDATPEQIKAIDHSNCGIVYV